MIVGTRDFPTPVVETNCLALRTTTTPSDTRLARGLFSFLAKVTIPSLEKLRLRYGGVTSREYKAGVMALEGRYD
jgi:hypothetical protein